jgi:lipopolysaccharide transport system permease protein
LVIADDGASPHTVLELSGESTPIPVLLRDLWKHRGLLPMLAAKDFHARYRSASLGILWSVFLPLLQGAVFAVVFTRVVRIPVARGTSYPVFVISGMVLWSYFTQSVIAGSTSIVDGASIAGKVFFPRLFLPAVPVLANAVSFTISCTTILGLMVVFGVDFSATLLLLPVAMLLIASLAALFAALLTLLHVYFRDVRYMVQAVLLVALYMAPVVYPLAQAKRLENILIANPVTGILQLMRFAIFGEAERIGVSLLVTVAWMVVLAVLTLLAYRRHERVAVDRL